MILILYAFVFDLQDSWACSYPCRAPAMKAYPSPNMQQLENRWWICTEFDTTAIWETVQPL
jgi:hypothetical protein